MGNNGISNEQCSCLNEIFASTDFLKSYLKSSKKQGYFALWGAKTAIMSGLDQARALTIKGVVQKSASF